MNLLYALFLLFQGTAVPMPERPSTSGVYFLQDNASWIRLQLAPIADSKIKGLDIYVRSGGYTNLGLKMDCRGSKAALRVRAPRPVFSIREAGSSKDAMLIRLTVQRNRRTFRATASDASTENRGGFKQQDIRKLQVQEYADHSFTLMPQEDLEPGEYLLFFGNVNSSYDFGVD